jgi:hypothetical protein
MENTLRRQASLLAFQDLFAVLLVMCAATLLLLVFFQRPNLSAKPAADVH